MSRLVLAKLGFSINPWRLCWTGEDGTAGGGVYRKRRTSHPLLGETVLSDPISGPTKEALIREVLDLLADALAENARLKGNGE